ncbi:MAG: Macrolide export ATP-binding/permease protein MacB [uncultured Caballeronia sp.]|nr:MAG: Macrolide export ATP-binding/permease protein MacB [uncultured Caballeronia sp.]
MRQVASLGPNTIDVYPGKDWGDSQASSVKTLVPSDAELLQRQSYVDSVTTETRGAALLGIGMSCKCASRRRR